VIDEDLAKLLKLLALYAAQRSAHAVLEYLVRKYRVHELNVDPFIRCLIPYHDTKVKFRMKIRILSDFSL
jgi:U3 small nucleolar RNA-associated protein 10